MASGGYVRGCNLLTKEYMSLMPVRIVDALGLASSPSCAKKDWSFRHLVFGTLGNIGNEHFGRRKRAHVHQHSLDVPQLGNNDSKTKQHDSYTTAIDKLQFKNDDCKFTHRTIHKQKEPVRKKLNGAVQNLHDSQII